MLCLLFPTLILTGVVAQPKAALSSFVIPTPHTGTIHNLVISDDQKKMITVGREGRSGLAMILWDLEAKKRIHTFPLAAMPQFLVLNEAFVSINIKFAGVSKGIPAWAGWEVNEHDAQTGMTKKVHAIEGDIRAVALWPDKKMVVAEAQPEGAPNDVCALQFFDYGTKSLHVLPVGERFRVMCFSHDRKLVVVKIGNGFLQVFDWHAKKKISEIQTLGGGSDEKCEYCMFLRDDSALLAGLAGSKELQVWDWKNAKRIKSLMAQVHPDETCPPALSPDGRLFVTFGLDMVSFFDTKTLTFLGNRERLTGMNMKQLQRICFMPDGRNLVLGDSGGNLRVFPVPEVEK
jgi:WD40 repeat protein